MSILDFLIAWAGATLWAGIPIVILVTIEAELGFGGSDVPEAPRD
jgi:hypothetical protein